MKFWINTFLGLLLISTVLFAQEERKVLVEVFTNSHCPLCPPAHEAIENYLNGPNGEKISYIFYHMVYPYSDDPLYYQSREGSDARDLYYNAVHATPQGRFDGVLQGSSSGWGSTLDNLVTTESPLKINLSGTGYGNSVSINAELTRTGEIPDSDLVLHFVVAENLIYTGRNNISHHIHVMRKMLPTPDGLTFSINLNETKNLDQNINLDPLWNPDSLNFVIFVQSTASKTVYQSETINYSALSITAVDDENDRPKSFILEQNYPNPFNPTTQIKFNIPHTALTTLKIFNLLGNEVSVLLNKNIPAGNYELTFDASELPAGVYFYTLQSGEFVQTKKMILLK
jgi:Secretion system C-terminal sorting domain/Outer membrane protein Omp28